MLAMMEWNSQDGDNYLERANEREQIIILALAGLRNSSSIFLSNSTTK